MHAIGIRNARLLCGPVQRANVAQRANRFLFLEQTIQLDAAKKDAHIKNKWKTRKSSRETKLKRRDPPLRMPTAKNIIQVMQRYEPNVDRDLITLAYDFAVNAHRGQKRLTGEDFIEHPAHVALILAEELKADTPTIIGGLFHDILEDTGITEHDIEKNFGEEVKNLVLGCTSLKKIKYRGIERYIENLRKMFIAMAKDIRVIFIKFADRLDNLKSLSAHPPEKKFRIAKETLEIYSPIANRLGMGEMKGLLEDAAFPFVAPEEYAWVKSLEESRLEEKRECLREIEQFVKKEIKKSNISIVSLHGRTKHLYSLYQKLLRHDRDVKKIYDLVAIRIIVQTIAQCYAVLGIIHEHFRPLKGRIKDYIATPKPNGYQSLHTTVFCPCKHITEIVEFQIRAQAMHEEAEWGIAAHWNYDETETPIKPKRHVNWVHQLTKWQRELHENQQYLETLKVDVFQNRIFVFTPKGEVIDLPENSTPIDFAYHIHTQIGHTCVGAMVNDQITPLDTKLKSGDVVEIVTDKNRKNPSADWLRFVKTGTARNKIKDHAKVHVIDWLRNVVKKPNGKK